MRAGPRSIATLALLLAPAALAQTAPPAAQPATPVAQTPPPAAQPEPSLALPPLTIIGASPLLGSGVDRDTVPAETNVLKRRRPDARRHCPGGPGSRAE